MTSTEPLTVAEQAIILAQQVVDSAITPRQLLAGLQRHHRKCHEETAGPVWAVVSDCVRTGASRSELVARLVRLASE